jgi:hypothetical protein
VPPPNLTVSDQSSGSGSQVTLETISAQITGLQMTVGELPEKIAKQQKESSKLISITLICSVIAAFAAIVAAIISSCSGSMTAKTNLDLARAMALKAEVAKADRDTYAETRKHIINLEVGFQNILFTKQIDRQNDPIAENAKYLNNVMTGESLGQYTNAIRDFDDFIVNTIATLQDKPDGWKNVKALQDESLQRQSTALDALEDWLWTKK